jgi:hypothetical protein
MRGTGYSADYIVNYDLLLFLTKNQKSSFLCQMSCTVLDASKRTLFVNLANTVKHQTPDHVTPDHKTFGPTNSRIFAKIYIQ